MLALRRWSLLTVAVLAVTACGAEAITEAEPEPEGLELRDGGQLVASVDANGTVTGSLTVAEGDETNDLTFVFTDADGNPLTIDTAEFFVGATVADEATALFHATAELEGHIQGIQAGSTTVVFHLMHPPGANPHAHWSAPAIPITVTP